jgi:iron complex transport system substrate-binding protein
MQWQLESQTSQNRTLSSTEVAPVRVISLLPAATDIIAALGATDRLVGVTHECDYPADVVQGLPRVTGSPIGEGQTTAGEIDRQVRESAQQGLPLFELHEPRMLELRPSVLVTQALCDVCAVSEDDVRAIAARMTPPPQVVTLSGTTFDGVFADITRVAEALGIPHAGEALLTTLRARIRYVHETLRTAVAPRPRVAVLEWTDPIYAAGHWVPEMIKRAGGVDVLSAPGTHSTTRTVDDVRTSVPEVLCIAPCGYDVARGMAEAAELLTRPEWAWTRRIPVWILNGNVLTSRPGPRIVDGVEVVAAVLHPALFPAPSPHDASRVASLPM